ncbi:MAG: four helix bundle protein [Rickettsiales bacterium]|jgi:four helix bundle protein|nr:four helix bundle protein [Rickettsiales bacterium]
MQSVKELDVYKLTFEMTIRLYKIVASFPKNETFNLVSQMQRAAISINSNLAEGGSRGTTGEYKHFVGIARGSASELAYQIEISKDLGFINDGDYKYLSETLDRIGQMLSGLIKKLSQ